MGGAPRASLRKAELNEPRWSATPLEVGPRRLWYHARRWSGRAKGLHKCARAICGCYFSLLRTFVP